MARQDTSKAFAAQAEGELREISYGDGVSMALEVGRTLRGQNIRMHVSLVERFDTDRTKPEPQTRRTVVVQLSPFIEQTEGQKDYVPVPVTHERSARSQYIEVSLKAWKIQKEKYLEVIGRLGKAGMQRKNAPVLLTMVDILQERALVERDWFEREDLLTKLPVVDETLESHAHKLFAFLYRKQEAPESGVLKEKEVVFMFSVCALQEETGLFKRIPLSQLGLPPDEDGDKLKSLFISAETMSEGGAQKAAAWIIEHLPDTAVLAPSEDAKSVSAAEIARRREKAAVEMIRRAAVLYHAFGADQFFTVRKKKEEKPEKK